MATNKPINVSSELLKKMGLDETQLDTTKATTKKAVTPSTKTEHLKADAKKQILEVNTRNGEEVRFQCLARNGKTKDGKPKYKLVNQTGFWTIDETKDGLIASRVHYYTETFEIVDYIKVGTNSDTKK